MGTGIQELEPLSVVFPDYKQEPGSEVDRTRIIAYMGLPVPQAED